MQSGLLQVLLIVCTGVASVPAPYFHNLYLAPRDGQHQPGSTSDYSPPGYGSSHTAYAQADGATSSPRVQAPTPQPHAPKTTIDHFTPGPLLDSHPSAAPPSFAPQSIASASNSGPIGPPGGRNVPYVGRPRFPHGPYLYYPVGDGNFYPSPPPASWWPQPGPQPSIHQAHLSHVADVSGGSVASQAGNSFSAGVDSNGTPLQGGTMGAHVSDSIGSSATVQSTASKTQAIGPGNAGIGGSTAIEGGAATGGGTGIVSTSGIGAAAAISSGAGIRGDVGVGKGAGVGGVLGVGHGITASHKQVIGGDHIARRGGLGLDASVGAAVGVVGAGVGGAMTGVGGVVGGVGNVAAGLSGAAVGVVGDVLGADIASGVGSALGL